MAILIRYAPSSLTREHTTRSTRSFRRMAPRDLLQRFSSTSCSVRNRTFASVRSGNRRAPGSRRGMAGSRPALNGRDRASRAREVPGPRGLGQPRTRVSGFAIRGAGCSVEGDDNGAEAADPGPLTAGCERDPPHAVTPASATNTATPITVERVDLTQPEPRLIPLRSRGLRMRSAGALRADRLDWDDRACRHCLARRAALRRPRRCPVGPGLPPLLGCTGVAPEQSTASDRTRPGPARTSRGKPHARHRT